MPVSVQCSNPDCHASFHVDPGDTPRFRRCPQCGGDLLADAGTAPGSTLASDPDKVRALAEDRPPPSVPDPLVGETLADRYRILGILGQGGMGTVYLAKDIRFGRKVAVKIPTILDSGDSTFLKRFRREAGIAAAFQHPNICPIYDDGTHNGRPFLVLAYIDGISLSDYLKRRSGPFDLVQAVKIIYVVARAMHKAHETGIIHRDLKPDNIMLSREGRPIVMDFGLARRADSGEQLTSAGRAFGTPAYMSMEQFQDAGTIDQRADIYSLGVTFYRLLTGRLPYRGSMYEIMGTLMKAVPPPPPTKLRPDVNPELEAICLKAMAREAGDRYSSMREFAEALDLWLKRTTGRASGVLPSDHSPAEIKPSEAIPSNTPGPEPRKPLGRGRGAKLRLLVALGLFGLLMVLGIVFYVATDHGTVQITVDDPAAVVRVDGATIKIEKIGEPITLTLRPGTHEMQATRGELVVKTRQFSLTRGGHESIRVEYVSTDPPSTWTSPSTGMTFALIPAGEFVMGSTDGPFELEARPLHPVKITRPFYLGVYEVTQAEYKQVLMDENPSYFSARGEGKDRVAGRSTDQHPVENLSWNDAIAFCNKMSERDGLKPYYRSREGEPLDGDGYRLPTEAEWEYACRARSATKFSFGDEESLLNRYAWYGEEEWKRHVASRGQERPERLRPVRHAWERVGVVLGRVRPEFLRAIAAQ